MGDIADDLIQQGQDAWFAHLNGECDYGCVYCDPPPKPKKKKARDK